MSRTTQRWAAFARAAASRVLAQAKATVLDRPDDSARAAADALARSAGAMRGGMLKIGQLMAYAPTGGAGDEAARRPLAALWDRAPAESAAAIRQVVSEELGGSPDDVFAAWDDTPIGAASLGQVHAARTRDGVEVAVKVQYPGIAEALRSDLESSSLLETLTGADVGGGLPADALARLRDAVLAELDYTAEAAWQERFRKAFARDELIVIPRVLPALSTRRVLVAERLPGRPLASIASGPDEERARVARAILRFAFAAPLRHRLVNADPNPGNYLVLARTVGFLDFGCAAELDEEQATLERRLWTAVLARDGETFRHTIVTMGLMERARLRSLDSDTFREWESFLAGPFMRRTPLRWTAAYARRLTELTGTLVRAGAVTLPAPVLLLWRQRLGVMAVLGALEPEIDFGGELRAILT